MLSLWNTATKKIEEIQPMKPPVIGMYTCGLTVYGDAHVGNLRTYTIEDVLQRVLEKNGLRVHRVLNITDVGHLTADSDSGEDKMEIASQHSGATVWDIAKRYTDIFLADARALNIKIPQAPFLCKATDHIKEQIELVKILEEKGYAYQISDGVYFDTAKFPSYGSFSGQKLDEKEEGARVAVNREKRNTTDFALWKLTPPQIKRQMEWESPWGKGFPGWHLECSAMAHKYLGQPFEIHCGGVDHIPIHHENEIAQSVAAYGVPLALYWMHIEFLLVDGHKMSKSIGNVYTLADVIHRGIDPVALRFFFLGAHYRQKQNFTWEAVHASQSALHRLQLLVREWTGEGMILADVEAEFMAALHDDLNVPKALAVMWKLVDSDAAVGDKAATILSMNDVLGLSLEKIVGKALEIPDEVLKLMEERNAVRQAKDWKSSDTIRDRIEELGWSVEDGKDGQKIRPKQSL